MLNRFFAFFTSIHSAFADGPALPAGTQAPAAASGGIAGAPNMITQIVPFALMFGVIYFLMIRPQQKKMKDQQNMLTALKVGDEVLTGSGILGRITEITDKVVSVEVANNVRVKMLKAQVTQVIQSDKL
jgi:preprotein translocase subunit YajC